MHPRVVWAVRITIVANGVSTVVAAPGIQSEEDCRAWGDANGPMLSEIFGPVYIQPVSRAPK